MADGHGQMSPSVPGQQSSPFILFIYFFPHLFLLEKVVGEQEPPAGIICHVSLPQVAAVGWAAAWQNSFQEKPPEPASWAAAPRRLGAAMEGTRPRGCEQESEP